MFDILEIKSISQLVILDNLSALKMRIIINNAI